MTGPTLVLLLVVVAVVALAGLWLLVREWVAQGAVEQRATPDDIEARASSLRVRASQLLLTTTVGRALEQRAATAGLVFGGLELGVLGLAALGLAFALGNALGPIWLGALAAWGAWGGLKVWLGRMTQRREEEFVAQLPDVARTLANATEASLSLPRAIALAADELGTPADAELRKVVRELDFGASTDEALQSLHERLPSRELGVLISTLVIQQRAGGDVVTALSEMSLALDRRKDVRREVVTLMSEATSTGYVTAALGIVLLVGLNSAQPGLVDAMAETWPGRIALLVSFGLYALAFLLIQRLTRIEV